MVRKYPFFRCVTVVCLIPLCQQKKAFSIESNGKPNFLTPREILDRRIADNWIAVASK